MLGPSGEIISDTLSETEGLVYRKVDIAQCVQPKQFHDVVGYYNRFDVFDLKVNRGGNRLAARPMHEMPLDDQKKQIEPIAERSSSKDGGVHIGHGEQLLRLEHTVPKSVSGPDEHFGNHNDH